jgi:O-antigen ligase
MNILKIFLLLAVVLLPDFYIVDPSVRVPFVAMALLVGFNIHLYSIPRPTLLTGKNINRLLGISLLFILYMALVDYFHGVQLGVVVTRIVSHLLIVLLLPAFVQYQDRFQMVMWFRRFVTISLIFAILQMLGWHYALADLVPHLGIIGSDIIRDELIDEYGRATGATYNTIAFAMQMVILILLVYGGYLVQHRWSRCGYGFMGLVGLFASQTRAALFGLVPAIIMGVLIFSKLRLKSALQIVTLIVAAIGLGFGLQQVAPEYLPYMAKEIDEGDTHRVSTNVFMTIGVLVESPWFGISPAQAWDVYYRHADRNAVVQHTLDMKTPTHHNQLGYYFRYYGVVGIALLFAVYFRIYKIIKASVSTPMRVFIGSLFILDFIYSMTHNNKLLTSPLLWVFLSLALLPEDKANRTLASATGGF